jgi:hypothetical protein
MHKGRIFASSTDQLCACPLTGMPKSCPASTVAVLNPTNVRGTGAINAHPYYGPGVRQSRIPPAPRGTYMPAPWSNMD